MADILSQEEIDALLEVDVDDDCDNCDCHKCCDDSDQRQIILYDFKRPNRVSKEELRAVKRIHDKVCNYLSINLFELLNTNTQIQLHSVDQMTYGEYLMGLPNPTSFNVFTLKPFEGKFTLEINPSIAYSIIDILLGGSGSYSKDTGTFTQIEISILNKVIIMILSSIKVGWDNSVKDLEVAPFLNDSVNYFNKLGLISQNEIVITCVIEVIIGKNSGLVNISYPVSNIYSILDKLYNKNLKGVGNA